MNMRILFTALVSAMMLFATMNASAQTFAYINSAEILAVMPEVAQMRSSLEAYQTQLQKKRQQMIQDYQQKEQTAMQKEERGELSRVQRETMKQELEELQEEIIQYDQEMRQKISKKEQDLLGPLLERVNEAIEAVAKEEGYAMIFDLTSGNILYADETSNVNDKVKAKLEL
jgi:outer membrane protein